MTYAPLFRFILPMALLLCAAGAQAQDLVSSAKNPADPKKAIANEAKLTARPVLPDALPGSRPDRAGAAPATQSAAMMTPNEALFDAVSRGDQAAARDALSRGADIDGRDMLGLTPLDLAVDLGRNDITFLLLSLRSASPGMRAGKIAPGRNLAAADKPAPAKSAPRVAAAARGVGPVTARTAPVQQVRAEARYAGDSGTPVPAAGFLGFGGAKP